MTLAGIGAQLLHAVLLMLAAPLVAAVLRWARDGFVATPAAILGHEGADLRRLWRKDPPRMEPASPLAGAAPAVGAATTVVAALLVPSFALGMALAPLADLLAIAGLLALARVFPLLACLDAGSARGGITAARHTRLLALMAAAAIPAILALALGAGGFTLDHIAAVRFEDLLAPVPTTPLSPIPPGPIPPGPIPPGSIPPGSMPPGAWPAGAAAGGAIALGAGRALAIIALAIVAIADLSAPRLSPRLDEPLAGPDLVLSRLTEALRVLVWFNLLLALILPLLHPLGLARPEFGLADWPRALLSWIAGLAVLTTLAAIAAAVLGPPRERSLSAGLMLAAGLAVLATVLTLAQPAPQTAAVAAPPPEGARLAARPGPAGSPGSHPIPASNPIRGPVPSPTPHRTLARPVVMPPGEPA